MADDVITGDCSLELSVAAAASSVLPVRTLLTLNLPFFVREFVLEIPLLLLSATAAPLLLEEMLNRPFHVKELELESADP